MVYPAVQFDAEVRRPALGCPTRLRDAQLRTAPAQVMMLQRLLGLPHVHMSYKRPRDLSGDEQSVTVFTFVLTSAARAAFTHSAPA